MTKDELQILAVEYAGHCISKLPEGTTEDVKLKELLKAYQKAFEQLPTVAAKELPQRVAGAF